MFACTLHIARDELFLIENEDNSLYVDVDDGVDASTVETYIETVNYILLYLEHDVFEFESKSLILTRIYPEDFHYKFNLYVCVRAKCGCFFVCASSYLL